MISTMTKSTLSGLCVLLGFTTCCLSWPTASKYSQKGYNYDIENDYAMPLMMGEEAYAVSEADNQWEVAKEPYEYDPSEALEYYEQPLALPKQSQQPKQLQFNPEIEALAKILYDANKEEEVWGQIVRERPETELEELKQLSARGTGAASYEKRDSSLSTTTTSIPPIKIKATPVPVGNTVQSKSNMAPNHHGQKEYPLLRPPMQPNLLQKSAPVITQRSLGTDKKPSPYDTLRKYLSIEDALKKEAEKRTATKQLKRSPIVTDTESLTSQLNKLKPMAS